MQTALNFDARQTAQIGMQQAIDSANNKDPYWSKNALAALKEYLKDKPLDFAFRVEEFRMWCKHFNKVPNPPSERAYGSIIKEAAKGGLVKSIGREPTTNPNAHGAYANHWIKI